MRTNVTLQTTAGRTLDVLRQAGVLDDTHVLETQLQRNAEERETESYD